MKVLHLGQTRHPGGVAQAIERMVIALKEAGVEPVLIGNGSGGLSRDALNGTPLTHTEPGKDLASIRRSLRQIKAVLQTHQPEIVHVHGRKWGLLTTLAGRRPDFFHLHNSHLTERVTRLDYGPIRRLSMRPARGLIVLDEMGRAHARQTLGYPAARIHIVPNGIDCAHFRPPTDAERADARRQFEVDEATRCVGFVGRLAEQKNPEAVIALAEACRERGLDVCFLIAGTGRLGASLKAQIQARSLENIVTLVGWQQPRAIYWASDLLVMPSRHEGFGLTAGEAMACGRAVLRSRTGGFTTMIEENVDGFGCDTTSEDFVRAGLRLLEQPTQLEGVGPKARGAALARFSTEKQTQDLLALYEQHLDDA